MHRGVHRRSPVLPRPRRLAPGLRIGRPVVATVLLVGAMVVGNSSAHADADADLAAAQAAVDETAERWFDAQSQSASLNAQIEQLELELANLQQRAQATRRSARVQASALYETSSSGRDASALFEGSSAMEASRRTELLTQINQLARDDLEAHARLVGGVRDRLSELETRRTELDETLERLGAEEAELQRRLARAQRAYREQQAAEAAALAAQARADESPSGTDAEPGDSDPDPTDSDSTQPDTTEPDDPDEPDEVDPPPPPEPGQHPAHNDPFLSCVRQRESRGDYTVVNWDGPWYGAYQFAAGTWNATASHAGRPELIGVLPHRASPWDQDDLAWVLYQWQGKGPWGGGCG